MQPPPKRFVILTHGRSGSTMFCDALSQHPLVHAYHEAFHPATRPQVNGRSYGAEEEGDRFMNDQIFREPNEFGKAIVGFKLFFFHNRDNPQQLRLWSHLQERRDLPILFLERRNPFDAYVSKMRAQQAQQWQATHDQPVPKRHNERISLSFPLCVKYMANQLAGMECLRRQFSHHRSLPVTYEELAADTQGTLSRCFDFLGVDPVQVQARHVKMTTVAHADGVENYAELHEEFQRTYLAPFVPAVGGRAAITGR